MMNALGYKIRKIRELKNLTQDHVSHELGISQAAYSKLEKGETDIGVEQAEKVASILGVSLNDLVTFDERVIFNITNNETGINQNILSQNNAESKLTQERIASMEKEIAYLKEIVELLRNKK